MKIVTVNNHTYQMSDELAAQNIAIASEAMAGRVCIFAIDRGGQIEMRRDTFPDKKKLMAAVAKFTRAGFLVHFHAGDVNAS